MSELFPFPFALTAMVQPSTAVCAFILTKMVRRPGLSCGVVVWWIPPVSERECAWQRYEHINVVDSYIRTFICKFVDLNCGRIYLQKKPGGDSQICQATRTIERPAFADVFPIENGKLPLSCRITVGEGRRWLILETPKLAPNDQHRSKR